MIVVLIALGISVFARDGEANLHLESGREREGEKSI